MLETCCPKNTIEILVGDYESEAAGKLQMVISNQHRQHPGIRNGINYDKRKGKRHPGMMFFNEKGDYLYTKTSIWALIFCNCSFKLAR